MAGAAHRVRQDARDGVAQRPPIAAQADGAEFRLHPPVAAAGQDTGVNGGDGFIDGEADGQHLFAQLARAGLFEGEGLQAVREVQQIGRAGRDAGSIRVLGGGEMVPMAMHGHAGGPDIMRGEAHMPNKRLRTLRLGPRRGRAGGQIGAQATHARTQPDQPHKADGCAERYSSKDQGPE